MKYFKCCFPYPFGKPCSSLPHQLDQAGTPAHTERVSWGFATNGDGVDGVPSLDVLAPQSPQNCPQCCSQALLQWLFGGQGARAP